MTDAPVPNPAPSRRRLAGLREWLAGWGSYFLWFIILYGVAAIVGLGLTWWLAGRDVAGDAARVGVPPLFAALLAWGLSESTRRQERSFQVATRRDERIAALDLERRRFQLDVLVDCQDALIETSRTATICLDAIENFYDTDPDHGLYDAARTAGVITPDERAFLDAASVLRQKSYRLADDDLVTLIDRLIEAWRWFIITGASRSRVDDLEDERLGLPLLTPPVRDFGELEQFRRNVERQLGQALRTLFPTDRTIDTTT